MERKNKIQALKSKVPHKPIVRVTPALTAEEVAYWYLRLNGFLMIQNFIVHGDRRGRTRTDIDVLGVRFRWRREHIADPMRDDDWVRVSDRTIVVFCDAKKGPEDLNPTWTDRNQKMMESFLTLIGVLPDADKQHTCSGPADYNSAYQS